MKTILLVSIILCSLVSEGQNGYSEDYTPCYFIGNNAGLMSYENEGVIVIGDKLKSDRHVYGNFEISIDPNFWYFKTEDGKRKYRFMERYLSDVENSKVSKRDRVIFLEKWIGVNMMQELIRHYKKIG